MKGEGSASSSSRTTTLSKKHHTPSGGDPRERIERTRREGKYQQALDLVKQLYKAEPTPAILELLKDVYLRRAEQLRGQGYLRDAATVLEVAGRYDEKNVEWLGKLATEMARCGEVTRTLAMAAKLPENARSGLMGPLVDGAIQQGKAGRDSLPADLRPEYDQVILAFAHAEAGRDDAAKEAMQSIGLRSPFLEWKVFLRGLQAYYVNDDDRARDNWQRLDPARLPARLAAPFRAAIDPAYRAAQPPQTQAILAQQHEQMQATTEGAAVKDLRANFNDHRSVSRAYRAAEQVMPRLKQEQPQLAARLARCFYWGLKETGPGEIDRYRRAFGPPPDDLNFDRLQALAYQENGAFETAHEHWQKYEKEIAAHPEVWPGEQGNLARALVWQQMAQNAALVPTAKQMKKLGGLLRLLQEMPPLLKPGAAECFEKSIELAPRLREAHEGLYLYLAVQEEEAKAIKAAKRLLEVFPDHVKTLDSLAALYLRRDKPAEAIPLLERALQHNPLSREFRYHLQLAHSAHARQLTAKSKFDQARTHFQSAITFSEPNQLCSAYCQWSACETKAGDAARAEELLRQARSSSPGELLITYNLLVEANRLQLPNAFRTKYTKAFNAAITEPATPELAVTLIRFVRTLDLVGIEYYGKATHWKKIFDYAIKLGTAQYSETQLESLLGNLVELEPPRRALQRMIDEARRRHPKNPFFLWYQLIDSMGDDPEGLSPWSSFQLGPMIDEAEKLAGKHPPSERLEQLKEDLRRRREMLRLLNPMRGLFGGGMGFFDDEEDFDDDDDDEW